MSGLRPLSSTIFTSINTLKNTIQQYKATATTSTRSPFSLFQQQQRYFSKYLSKSAKKRLPINTKWAGKGYVKGKGCTTEGRKTSKGRFIVNPSKRLQLMVPVIDESFKLKPYIAAKVSKVPPELRR